MSRLDDAMQKLAAELAEGEPPQGIGTAVLAEFERARRRRRGRQWTAGIGALAAASAAMWLAERRPVEKAAPAPMAEQTESEQPFIPIPYVLPPAPYERVEVVRMQVPVAALIAAGLPMQVSDAGAQAEADVLVGQDGRPRAVRLVSISSY